MAMADSKEVHYTLAPTRLGPIPEDQMTAAQKAAVDGVMSGPRKHMGGPFSALLRSPELMNRVQKVGEYLRFLCPLEKRLGEFAAIISARHYNQQFEWWAHYRQAVEAGLKADIADTNARLAMNGDGARRRRGRADHRNRARHKPKARRTPISRRVRANNIGESVLTRTRGVSHLRGNRFQAEARCIERVIKDVHE